MRGYLHFQETFGSDEFFVVAFDARDVFSAESLALVADLTEELGALSADLRWNGSAGTWVGRHWPPRGSN